MRGRWSVPKYYQGISLLYTIYDINSFQPHTVPDRHFFISFLNVEKQPFFYKTIKSLSPGIPISNFALCQSRSTLPILLKSHLKRLGCTSVSSMRAKLEETYTVNGFILFPTLDRRLTFSQRTLEDFLDDSMAWRS